MAEKGGKKTALYLGPALQWTRGFAVLHRSTPSQATSLQEPNEIEVHRECNFRNSEPDLECTYGYC